MQIKDGRRAYSVGELTRYIKTLLLGQRVLQNIAVSGEVSNLRRQQSGHMYFTLKDDTSSLSCVMFRSHASSVAFELKNGQKVWAIGGVGLYEVTGSYQLYVERLEPVGQGALQLAFEQLKARLASEGLFEQSRKRQLPQVPTGVGLVTSPSGAAIKDLVSIIRRRFPAMPIVLAPTQVQGKEAPTSICQAIEQLNHFEGIDVIVVARGGGALEDLWCFNDESVARAIASSRYPVVSAVGHETDVTIADFVADLRAPTPSAAAELVVPEVQKLRDQVEGAAGQLESGLQRWLWQKTQRVHALQERLRLHSPDSTVKVQMQRVDDWVQRAGRAVDVVLREKKQQMVGAVSQLEQLSPLATLCRGYAVCRNRSEQGSAQIVKSVEQLQVGLCVEVLLSDGQADCQVQAVSGKQSLGGAVRDEV